LGRKQQPHDRNGAGASLASAETSPDCRNGYTATQWLNFELGQDIIKPGDRRKVARACAALRSLFERDVSLRDEVEIWIEGHTDSIQPKSAATKRDRYLYNWHLSSKRAASVLHEFHACGLDPARYRIFAIGYANTRPRLDLAHPLVYIDERLSESALTVVRLRLVSRKGTGNALFFSKSRRIVQCVESIGSVIQILEKPLREAASRSMRFLLQNPRQSRCS
jgi:outer membrane protein OmpA-like peptidoglycan-associated protein